MICTIKIYISVQVASEGGEVESSGFVSVVNFRMVSELRGVKFELKIEGITYIR